MPAIETQLIERAFQELINTKHLYQSIEIDFRPTVIRKATEERSRRAQLAAAGGGSAGPNTETIVNSLLTELDAKNWLFVTAWDESADYEGSIPFSLLPVKTLCSVCDDVTSFNPWASASVSAATMSPGVGHKQVFCLPLQCQGCRSSFIGFMVARNDRKIQLVGRSEFEHVQVPPCIPKDQKDFYSQAVIAFNCGQFLPALFVLRTLIEQHMRAATGLTDLRGDELCDAYNKTLENDFKARFPSFKEIYGNLSDAMHRADPNESLFKSELERVVLHFEALMLYAKGKKPVTDDSAKPK